MGKKSKLEETLALQLRAEKIRFEREVFFHPVRKWRFDFTILIPNMNKFRAANGDAYAFGVEVDGGQWSPKGGRHSGDDDYEKRNEATIAGIPVLYFTGSMVRNNTAIEFILATIEAWSGK